MRNVNRLRISPLLASVVILAAAAVVACGVRDKGGVLDSHPGEFVGRWVQHLPDSSWGDTLELMADGSVRGSASNRVPPSARWGISMRNGIRVFCAVDSKESSCESFRLGNGLLVVGDRLQGQYTYRQIK